jgi:hypothetical protein
VQQFGEQAKERSLAGITGVDPNRCRHLIATFDAHWADSQRRFLPKRGSTEHDGRIRGIGSRRVARIGHRAHHDGERSCITNVSTAGVVNALSLIGQDLVGLGDLAKMRRRLGVVRVGVGMSAEGQAAVGLDYLGLRGVRPHLEASVIAVVEFGSGHKDLSRVLTDLLSITYHNISVVPAKCGG